MMREFLLLSELKNLVKEKSEKWCKRGMRGLDESELMHLELLSVKLESRKETLKWLVGRGAGRMRLLVECRSLFGEYVCHFIPFYPGVSSYPGQENRVAGGC